MALVGSKGDSYDNALAETINGLYKTDLTHKLAPWKSRESARIRARLPQVRVHDRKHTFGRRLRAAGVSFEDRQDLLGHRSGRITTHYSAAELEGLIAAAEKVCSQDSRKSPALVLLKKKRFGPRP